MKRTMNVLMLAAALYGVQASAESAFPAPSPDDLPPLSGTSYAEMHAADIALQPFSAVLAGNADIDPLPSEWTYADAHKEDIARQPFSVELAGNADLEPLNQWTHAERKAVESNVQAFAD